MPLTSNVVCPFCGCCCDDIKVFVKDNKIIRVENACALGRTKLIKHSIHRHSTPLIKVDGKQYEATLKNAVERSAEILVKSSYPILYGWSCTSCEAISAGIQLAEKVGGVFDSTSSVCHGPSTLAFQDIGFSGGTLGQIRHRADLIIYWGSNPQVAHPRHLERYTLFSDGRFKSRRRPSSIKKSELESKKESNTNPSSTPLKDDSFFSDSERKLVVVDVRKTRTSAISDCFIEVEPNKDYEVLQALRAILRDEFLEVEKVGGIPVEKLEEMVDIMLDCKFGVMFFGLGLTMSKGTVRNIDAASSLIRDLNRYTKFLIQPMRGHFNVTGSDSVSTWQTGYPYAVDFSSGFPRYNPGETTVIDILQREDSDASLIIGSDPVASFPRKAVLQLSKNPIIVIDPKTSLTSLVADVVIPSSLVGIESEGTCYRMDGVPLPLRKIVDPHRKVLSDEEILRLIINEVNQKKHENTLYLKKGLD